MASNPADIKQLAGELKGAVILPDSPQYAAARLVANSRFDDVRPAAVLRPIDADDVCTAVAFMRDREIRPVLRSGGHSFAGHSTGEGVVLDLSELNAFEVDSDKDVVRLGAG